MAFRREKFVPRGGPSGGDGGAGGSVILVGDESRNTLYHLRSRSIYKADRGKHGEGSNCTGRSAEDMEIPVPLGTVVKEAESGEVFGEVLRHGECLTVAAGGRGGRGNARFASATNQAPRRHEPGEEGEERRLRLELKLLADVGVVGLPNAGKSTLISRLSAARPKIADYPFTTLVPQLGMVADRRSDAFQAEPFVIADLPGLIEGAAAGAGLGFRFLRHAERCRVLLHLVDLSGFPDPGISEDGTSREGGSPEVLSAEADLATIEGELEAFSPELARRPRIVVGSKVDAAQQERRESLTAAAEARDLPYLEISSATGAGIDDLITEIRRLLALTPAPAFLEEAGEPEAAWDGEAWQKRPNIEPPKP